MNDHNVGEPENLIERLVDAWRDYPSLESGYPYDEVLGEVQNAAQRSGSIGKSDIGALMLWKRLNLSTRWTRALNDLPDRQVRELTQAAIAIARDASLPAPEAAETARTALLELPGCRYGAAVVSTILTAGAPDRMAIYDARAARALIKLGFANPSGGYRCYMEHVCSLRDDVNATNNKRWRPRDVDMALYVLGARSDPRPRS